MHSREQWKRILIIGTGATFVTAALIVLMAVQFEMSGIKKSQPFRDAMQRAAADPRIIAAVGEPMRPAWLVSGSTMSGGGVSATELRIPIKGPNGRATLHVAGAKPPGLPWRYDQMTAELRSGRVVNLLQ